MLCLDAREPGTVFKKLDTGSLIFSSNFHEIFHLILLRIIALCLEMPSDSESFFFGFVVEQLFELGHTMKSLCSRHLENIHALTHRVNSHRNIHKGYQRRRRRRSQSQARVHCPFSICQNRSFRRSLDFPKGNRSIKEWTIIFGSTKWKAPSPLDCIRKQ